jgi:FlaA1/EpsC-like NDP-sugar epimerase
MIRLAGHRDGEVAIEISGLRPGEKLYEELLADTDRTLPTAFPRLRVARLADRVSKIDRLLDRVWHDTDLGAPSAVLLALRGAVPEYAAALSR